MVTIMSSRKLSCAILFCPDHKSARSQENSGSLELLDKKIVLDFTMLSENNDWLRLSSKSNRVWSYQSVTTIIITVPFHRNSPKSLEKKPFYWPKSPSFDRFLISIFEYARPPTRKKLRKNLCVTKLMYAHTSIGFEQWKDFLKVGPLSDAKNSNRISFVLVQTSFEWQ